MPQRAREFSALATGTARSQFRIYEETGVGLAAAARLDPDRGLRRAAHSPRARAAPDEAEDPARSPAPAAQHRPLPCFACRARGAGRGNHDRRLARQPAAATAEARTA